MEEVITFIAPSGMQVKIMLDKDMPAQPATALPEWEIWQGTFTDMGMEGRYQEPIFLGKYKAYSFLDACLKWWKSQVDKYGSWEAADKHWGGFRIAKNGTPRVWGIGLYDNFEDANKR